MILGCRCVKGLSLTLSNNNARRLLALRTFWQANSRHQGRVGDQPTATPNHPGNSALHRDLIDSKT